jgi:fatty acid-binding protein DegV
VGKKHKRKLHILAHEGLWRLIKHAKKWVIDLFEIMPVEKLKRHRLGVLQTLEHGMNRKKALEVIPDARGGSGANREAIILHLVKRMKNERNEARENHGQNEFKQKLHVDQRGAVLGRT